MSTKSAQRHTFRSTNGDFSNVLVRSRPAKLMFRPRGSGQTPFHGTPPHHARCGKAATKPRSQLFPLLARDRLVSSKASYLHDIYIQDFALVEEQYARLHPCFNVITGKSGSGKSVFLDAISQLCGAPAHKDLVRIGADCAILRGTFILEAGDAAVVRNILRQSGMPELEWESLGSVVAPDSSSGRNIVTGKRSSLKVERRLITVRQNHVPSPNNIGGRVEHLHNQANEYLPRVRSVCKINGATIPLKVLRELGSALVDFNGQGAATLLSTEDSQRKLLDAWGGTSHLCSQFDKLATLLIEYRAEAQKLSKIGGADRLDLEDLINEVDAVGPRIGEDAAIKAKLRRMKRVQSTLERFDELSRSLVNGRVTNRDGSSSIGVLRTLTDASSQLKSLIAISEKDSNDFHLSSVNIDTQSDWQNTASFAEEQTADDDENTLGLADALSMCQEAKRLISRAESIIVDHAGLLRVEPQVCDQYIRRLRELDRLCRKIGVKNATEANKAAKVAINKLKEADCAEQKEHELFQLIQATVNEIVEVGSLLSETRQGAAISFSQHVNDAVSFLSMDGSRFDVSVSWKSAAARNLRRLLPEAMSHVDSNYGDRVSELAKIFDETEEPESIHFICNGGFDEIIFRLASDPNAPLRPLRSIASGGEMARILLAIKLAPTFRKSEADKNTDSSFPCENTSEIDLSFEVPGCPDEERQSPINFHGVSVFDELDSGVGARVGNQIGAALRKLSHDGGQQVLCVTHLPQVAAHGDFHLCIKKRLDSHLDVNYPISQRKVVIDTLTEVDSRVEELAHMLGLGNAPQGISAAMQLLESAQHTRN